VRLSGHYLLLLSISTEESGIRSANLVLNYYMHMQEIKTTLQNALQSLTIYTLNLSQLHEVQLVLKVDLMVQIYFKLG